jgi:hypothetical protein
LPIIALYPVGVVARNGANSSSMVSIKSVDAKSSTMTYPSCRKWSTISGTGVVAGT